MIKVETVKVRSGEETKEISMMNPKLGKKVNLAGRWWVIVAITMISDRKAA